MKDIFTNIKKVACIYTVEILPPTKKSSVMAFKYGEGDNGPKMPITEVREWQRKATFIYLETKSNYYVTSKKLWPKISTARARLIA